MSDLIKREDAIEMVHAFFRAEIDRELPYRDSDEYTMTTDEMKRLNMLLGYNKGICIRLKVIPPEDAAPVVRCKDCGHADEFGHCYLVEWWNQEHDFCSLGERREDGKG